MRIYQKIMQRKIYAEETIYKEIFIHRVQCREYYKQTKLHKQIMIYRSIMHRDIDLWREKKISK